MIRLRAIICGCLAFAALAQLATAAGVKPGEAHRASAQVKRLDALRLAAWIDEQLAVSWDAKDVWYERKNVLIQFKSLLRAERIQCRAPYE